MWVASKKYIKILIFYKTTKISKHHIYYIYNFFNTTFTFFRTTQIIGGQKIIKIRERLTNFN